MKFNFCNLINAILHKLFFYIAVCLPLVGRAQDTCFNRQRLRDVIVEAWKANDKIRLKMLGEQYVDCIKDSLTKDDMVALDIIRGSIDSTHDKIFMFFLGHADKLDSLSSIDWFTARSVGGAIYDEEIAPSMSVKGFDWVRISASLKSKYPIIADKLVRVEGRKVRSVILDEIKAPLYPTSASLPDWAEIEGGIRAKYPNFDYRAALLEAKVFYFANREMWTQSTQVAETLMQQCGEQFIDHNELTKNMNEIVWVCVFQHSCDRKILREAADWMKRLLERERRRQYVDTYANVLYKLGDLKEAIAQEEDALAAAQRSAANPDSMLGRQDAVDFAVNLEKMKAGKPTWEEEIR